jgi:cytochrome c556
MKVKHVVVALTAIVLSSAATFTFAQVKPEVLVKQRQAAMTLQGKYFGPMAAMAQGKAPFDAKVVARNAGFLEALAHMPWDGFDASTKDVKSTALPAVYSDAAKFKQAQENFQAAVGKLVAASKGSDEAATKAAIGGIGKTCGGCHDDFRPKP